MSGIAAGIASTSVENRSGFFPFFVIVLCRCFPNQIEIALVLPLFVADLYF